MVCLSPEGYHCAYGRTVECDIEARGALGIVTKPFGSGVIAWPVLNVIETPAMSVM